MSRVTITAYDIDSVFGLCTILSRKREGATFAVHLECKGPNGNQMLGDVVLRPGFETPGWAYSGGQL